jgi:tetratricopeptide (TPR) repeat protein
MISKVGRSLFLVSTLLSLFSAPTTTLAFHSPSDISTSAREQLRQEWLENSVNYYSKVMREERRKNLGQVAEEELASQEYQQDFQRLAQKHWFAIRKVKEGQYEHAETIYKKIISEIMADEDEHEQCDHAKLAVTTLLLALHCQRMGDLKKTRSVFLNFFRVVVVNNSESGHSECACSAKVLGAFALFEMKQGNAKKSLEIARKAVEFDPALEPVLNWKQFREVARRQQQQEERVKLNSTLHP